MNNQDKRNPVVDNIMMLIVAIILFAFGVMFGGYFASKSSVACSRLDMLNEKCIVSQKNFFEYKKTVIPLGQIKGMDVEIGRKHSSLYIETTSQGHIYPHFFNLKGGEGRKILDDFNTFIKDKNMKTFEYTTDFRTTGYCIGIAFFTVAFLLIGSLIVRLLIFFWDMIF